MTSFFDIGVRDSAAAWRALRGRRAAPPVPAGSRHARAATFRSALEQAEQQFRAAATVGYDSRSLNLFYGLSQAGRAVAAAASVLGNGEWALLGHGLTNPNLASFGGGITSVVVKTAGRDNSSFVRLSEVLNSPTSGQPTLGELWPLMWETTVHARLGQVLYQPLHVHPGGREGNRGRIMVPAEVQLQPVMLAVGETERPRLPEFLERYPALSGWELQQAPELGSQPGWPIPANGFYVDCELTASEVDAGHTLQERLTLYRGNTMAFPTIAREKGTRHPLMAWWGVLYTLSMLTRYHPAEWTKLIDVNQSAQATALEFVLDTALTAVPDLLDEAIDQVASPQHP